MTSWVKAWIVLALWLVASLAVAACAGHDWATPAELVRAAAGDDSIRLPVSPAARGRVLAMLERFNLGYEMPTYNLNRSADTVLVQIDRLRRRAAALDGTGLDEQPKAWGDLFCEVKALLALASPILIDLAAAAREAGVFDGSPDAGVLAAGAFDISEVTPFAPPLLTADPTGGDLAEGG